MEDSSRQELNQPHQSDDVDEAQHGDEEVEGLLSGMSTSKTNDARKKSTRGRRIQIFLAVIFLSFCFGLFIVVPAFIPDSRQRHKQDDVIMSNGTHEYRKTVLMVSIDGLRYGCISNSFAALAYACICAEPIISTAGLPHTCLKLVGRG
jgi:hypothetical protein